MLLIILECYKCKFVVEGELGSQVLLVEYVEKVLMIVGLKEVVKEKFLILEVLKLRLKDMGKDMVDEKVKIWTVLLLVLHLFISILLLLLHLEHSFSPL